VLVTVFLVVLVTALVLGNVFLTLLKPVQAQCPSSAAVRLEKPRPGVFRANGAFEEAVEKERIQLLGKRIDRLEGLLLRINGSHFLGKKLNGTVLGQKLNDFTQFKDNTKLEIAALKQEVARLKGALGMHKEPKQDDYQISDEKLHELVFQHRSGKANF
jgi:uncharacterized small protein (DUF1192 family)